jgi:hypothetical protein
VTGQQRKVTLGNRSGGLLIRFIFYIIYTVPQYELEEGRREKEGFNASAVKKADSERDLATE